MIKVERQAPDGTVLEVKLQDPEHRTEWGIRTTRTGPEGREVTTISPPVPIRTNWEVETWLHGFLVGTGQSQQEASESVHHIMDEIWRKIVEFDKAREKERREDEAKARQLREKYG